MEHVPLARLAEHALDGVSMIQTIGYKAVRFDRSCHLLVANRTRLLIDVRAIAASRRAGFSKRALARGLEQGGIGYLQLQPLGTPRPGRDAVRRGDVDARRRIFRTPMDGDRAQAAPFEARALATRQRVCLLCFERDHAHCHRSLVAEMITNGTGRAIRHLEVPLDLPEPVSSRARRLRP